MAEKPVIVYSCQDCGFQSQQPGEAGADAVRRHAAAKGCYTEPTVLVLPPRALALYHMPKTVCIAFVEAHMQGRNEWEFDALCYLVGLDPWDFIEFSAGKTNAEDRKASRTLRMKSRRPAGTFSTEKRQRSALPNAFQTALAEAMSKVEFKV